MAGKGKRKRKYRDYMVPMIGIIVLLVGLFGFSVYTRWLKGRINGSADDVTTGTASVTTAAADTGKAPTEEQMPEDPERDTDGSESNEAEMTLPAAEATDESTDMPADKPADESADEPADEPANESSDEPADKSADVEDSSKGNGNDSSATAASETSEETSEETGEAVHAVSISAEVCGEYYIGSTLDSSNFRVTVELSDGTVLTDPPGWGAWPLTLSKAVNEISLVYEDITGTVTVEAGERPQETAAPETAVPPTTVPQTTVPPTTVPPTTVPPTTVPPTTVPETTVPETQAGVTHTNRRVFIGDSRVVQLQLYCAANALDTYIALGGSGYSWFSGSAVPCLTSILSSEQIDAVIIMMGVNDCAETCISGDSVRNFASAYAAQIGGLIANWPNTRFYVCTVYHTDGLYDGIRDLTPEEVNPQIDLFNASIAGCGASVIDVCGYVDAAGIASADGVHIKDGGCRLIYNYIVGSITIY